MKINEITKRIKLPAKASVYYLAASFLGKAVSFAITPFTTRLLDKEQYGQLSLYMTVLGCASLICATLTSSSAFYSGFRKYESDKNEYLKSVLMLNTALALIICILLFTFSPFLQLNRLLLMPMSLQILCDGIIAISLSAKRYDYRFKSASATLAVNAALPPLLSIIILKSFGGGYLVRVYSMLLVSFCVAARSLSDILRKNVSVKSKTLKYLLKSFLPLLPNGLSGAFFSQADRLFISAIMGAVALAKYSVVYSLGVALQFTVSAIGHALTPWMLRRLDSGEEGLIAQLLLPMTVGYYALSLCVVAAAPELMLILAPSDYLEAVAAILPLSLSTPLVFISSAATVGITHSEKSGYLIISSAVGAVSCIAFNFIFINAMGYLGAGISSLLSHGAKAVTDLFLLKKVGKENIIPIGKIALLCLFGLAAGGVIYFMQGSVLLRIISLALPFAMLAYCARRALALVMEKGEKKAI